MIDSNLSCDISTEVNCNDLVNNQSLRNTFSEDFLRKYLESEKFENESDSGSAIITLTYLDTPINRLTYDVAVNPGSTYTSLVRCEFFMTAAKLDEDGNILDRGNSTIDLVKNGYGI